MAHWEDLDAFLRRRGVRIGAPTLGQTTGGTHAAGSYHYRGLARDYGDAASDCRAVVNALLPFAGPGGPIVELFYAPMNVWRKNGQQLSRAAIGDHDDHAHAAIRADGVLPAGPTPSPADPQEEPVGAFALPILEPGHGYTFRPPPANGSGGLHFGDVWVSFGADFGDVNATGDAPLRLAHWNTLVNDWEVSHGGGTWKNDAFTVENPDVPPLWVPTRGNVVAVKWDKAWTKGSLINFSRVATIVPLVEYGV